LWRSALVTTLPQKSILNFRVDLAQPLLGTLGMLPICFNLGFEFCNAILCSPQLLRKLSRRVDCMSAVLLGDISRFAQKLQDRLAGFVELTVIVSLALARSRKLNYFGTHVDTLSLSTFSRIYRPADT
jgi:hypothetical protein